MHFTFTHGGSSLLTKNVLKYWPNKYKLLKILHAFFCIILSILRLVHAKMSRGPKSLTNIALSAKHCVVCLSRSDFFLLKLNKVLDRYQVIYWLNLNCANSYLKYCSIFPHVCPNNLYLLPYKKTYAGEVVWQWNATYLYRGIFLVFILINQRTYTN